MQIKKTNVSDTKVSLSVSADQDFMDRVKTHTLKHLGAKHVKLPGFRDGKAPLALIEKNVDASLLQSEFLEEAINRLYVETVKVENLKPIGQPEVNLKKFVPFTELQVEINQDVIGPVTLPDYKKIKKPLPTTQITDEDIDGVMETLKRRMADKKEVDRAAKNGDEAVINFFGTDSKGAPVSGADGKDFPLVLGSNTFIPGFEPEIIGMKSGDEKTFNIVFPKDYQVAALQSKKVTFKVSLTLLSELIEPKVDSEFAAKAGPFKTVKELKEDIRRQLGQERQNDNLRAYENELIQEIADKSKVELPEKLIDEQVQRAEEEERRNLAYRGQTWQEHLEQEGVTEDEHRARQRDPAKLNVKASLVLSEIAERENIAVTPEELEIRVQILKGQYADPAMQTELDKSENRNELISRMLTEKTIARLVEYAQN